MEEFDLNWNNDAIVKYCSLNRSKIPIITKVQLDEKVLKASEPFDYEFDGNNKFYPYEFPEKLKNLDFQILVITGSSGAGKSVFSKYFGEEEIIDWDNSKSIISNFNTEIDGVNRLSATGLSSIPTWCRPYYVLSVGEKFRADLARKLKSNCVIDEFTSTVNRETALSCSVSVSKYIRKNNLKKCVFVSCHKDFIDALCPDYVIDLDDECVYDTRGLLRRKFKLSIYETDQKIEMWKLFKRHHYLTSDFNIASKMFIAYLNNIPVACCAILPLPSGTMKNAWRVHRLVVLPDYQGLGIGSKLLEYVCDVCKYNGKTIYMRTAHTKLINYMKKSLKWQGKGVLIHSRKHAGLLAQWKCNSKRLSTSFKYIAECSNNNTYNYKNVHFPIALEKENTTFDLNLNELW